MDISNLIEEMATPIHDFLVKNSERHTIRCYMPGHKGTEDPLDITEIDGADSLYDTDTNGGKGIIAQSEKNASKLFGSKRTLFSCSGSTLAIQTMLTLAKLRGNSKDHVIAGRYSHRSFINSCILLGLIPSWVYPEEYLSAAVTPESIEAKINSRTLAVFINSIDYYGGMSNISAIAEVCHSHGIPLLVDNAHGAYLKFAPVDLHPMTLGADMCADSAHKTLPVLTGGAYLHIANEKYCAMAKEAMALTATSSPSYLILDSLDRCNRTIAEKPFHIAEICNKVTALKRHCADMGYVLSQSDYMKVTFDCAAVHSTGFAMAEMLKEFGIECEYADEYRCVLLFGSGSTDVDFETIKTVLRANTPRSVFVRNLPSPPVHIRTQTACSPAKAYFSGKVRLPVMMTVGKVCAGAVAPCPPGIPLIMPGEVVTIDAARALRDKGIADIPIVV